MPGSQSLCRYFSTVPAQHTTNLFHWRFYKKKRFNIFNSLENKVSKNHFVQLYIFDIKHFAFCVEWDILILWNTESSEILQCIIGKGERYEKSLPVYVRIVF